MHDSWYEPLSIPRQREIICSPYIQALQNGKREVSSLGPRRAVSPSVHSTDVLQPGPESVLECPRKCNSVLRHDLRHRMSEDDSTVVEVLALKHEIPRSIPPEATGKERQVWQDMLGWYVQVDPWDSVTSQPNLLYDTRPISK